jgi:hypothetical protein
MKEMCTGNHNAIPEAGNSTPGHYKKAAGKQLGLSFDPDKGVEMLLRTIS